MLALACQLTGGAGATAAATIAESPGQTAPTLAKIAQTSRMTAVAQAGSRMVAVGPRGLILLSDDKGKTWRQAQTPVASDLVAVRFQSARDGWIAGHDGVILHTGDGGEHWAKKLDGVKAAAIIAEYYERLAASRSGTEAQALRDEARRFVDDGADKPFLDVLFISGKEGFAVGAFNLAMRTTDAGSTWTPLVDRTANPKALHLYTLALVGSTLYAGGEQGLLRRWNRVAGQFETVEAPTTGSLFGLLGKGNALYAFGLQGRAFCSQDGGRSWTHLDGTGNASLTAGALLPDGRIAFVSQGGKVLVSADGGQSFSERSGSRSMPYAGVAVAGPHTLSVVGSNGIDAVELD